MDISTLVLGLHVMYAQKCTSTKTALLWVCFDQILVHTLIKRDADVMYC